jgi:hypothetical protein
MLLSVYAVFFSVQFFFNFDGPGPGYGQTILYSCAAHSNPAGAHFQKSGLSTSNAPVHNIRLNKRFHQEDLYPCPLLRVEAPEQYEVRQTLGHYTNRFLPSFTPFHPALRGPPVAA